MTKKLAALILLSPAIAHAEPAHGVEVGVAIGGHDFSKDVELGVADAPDEPSPDSSGMFGARVAVPILSRLAIEGEAMVIPTKDDVLGKSAMVYGLRAHARLDLLTGKLRPFLVAGYGMHVIRSSSPQMDNDVDPAFHWGGGVRYLLGDHVDIRVDARDLIVPDREHDGATNDFEFTLGMTYRFGRVETPAVVVVVAPPPAPPPPEPPSPPAPPPPPPPEPPHEVIASLAGIGFELDSANLDTASASILDRAYVLLRDHPDLSVEISGHTSSEGDPARNRALSLQRAEAVKAYLVVRGIDGTRILTAGDGSDDPVADNATEAGRKQNRRIEFRILTAQDLAPLK